ncbi:4Fe-4S cluster-binding domain-containing protein [Streptomyces sp. DSM 44917]|uniref:4Fe-4S cluster-binding domain-containing protein n=1 Tax=Streptomyces boetiae TaxID=3075541 RepID=A0ABU2LBT3_9ACTN|nr:4Fe-4S cluster-binding domain-containing protein [Streptomyces sp. DSM 44917]MDT0309014.1 4Fe-4S cluster-binding domain-containing protein [Streptomyces sp. DSM 44917]
MARIASMHFPVATLGPGRRLGVWFQGCALACRGCMSRHTWDPEGGSEEAVDRLVGRWREALEAGAEGLTVSGGEPLAQPEALSALLAGAAAAREAARGGPDGADLLVYTGHTEEEIAADPRRAAAVRDADALITGRYEAARPTTLVWRGSANQRLLPRTPLGRRRYGPHLERTAAAPALEAVAAPDGRGVLLHGVPRPGELAELERRLRAAGTRLNDRSWRPGPDPGERDASRRARRGRCG